MLLLYVFSEAEMHSVIVEKEEIKIKKEVENKNENFKDLADDHLSDLSIKHNSKIYDDNQHNYEELTNIIDKAGKVLKEGIKLCQQVFLKTNDAYDSAQHFDTVSMISLLLLK